MDDYTLMIPLAIALVTASVLFVTSSFWKMLVTWVFTVLSLRKERAFGDWSPGRYGWKLKDPRVLSEPIHCKGSLGLWKLPPEVADKLAGAVLDSREWREMPS